MSLSNKTNLTDEFIEVTNADVIVTLTTSTLSIIGALTIFITSANKYSREHVISETRKLLIYLTIADFFIAVGYLIGAIRFLKFVDNIAICNGNQNVICLVQSFITTMFSMSSFFWTIIIMFHLWWTYDEHFQFRRESTERDNLPEYRFHKRTFVYHCVSWGIPAAITSAALGKNALGFDMSVGSGAWCWITACMTDRERTIWMTVSGKGWEILMYFSGLSFYILLKMFKKIFIRRNRQSNRNREDRRHPNENIKFLYLWLIEVALRIFGTIRFIMAAIQRHTLYQSDYYEHIDPVFLHIQSFGDSAQALFTCLIFCVLRKKNLTRMLAICRGARQESTPLLIEGNDVPIN